MLFHNEKRKSRRAYKVYWNFDGIDAIWMETKILGNWDSCFNGWKKKCIMTYAFTIWILFDKYTDLASKMHGRWIENSRRPLGSASLSSFLNLESHENTSW